MIGADARSDLASSQQAFVDLLDQPAPAAALDRTSRRESIAAASVHSSARINRSRSHSREHLANAFLHQLHPQPIWTPTGLTPRTGSTTATTTSLQIDSTTTPTATPRTGSITATTIIPRTGSTTTATTTSTQSLGSTFPLEEMVNGP
nr:transmembrane channel-like protein [Cherax quadricarinatus]